MAGADKLIKPLGVETENDGLDLLLLEVRNAMLQPLPELPDLTGAEAYLSAADWRALEDCGRQLADKLLWKTRQLRALAELGTNEATSEETPAMSMALEDTSVRPCGQRGGIDVYHSTCEPSIPTTSQSDDRAGRPPTADAEAQAAVRAYHRALEDKCIGGFRFLRLLGQGGQGKVFLCRCPGADGFSRVVALKLFSPDAYPTLDSYQEAMRRIARVATRVALESHNHVVDVQRFLKRDQIRIMLMERVEGFDLRRLLQARMLERFRQRASAEDWIKTNQIVVTAGPEQSRILPGAAVTIMRDCLEGLRALHVMGVVHGDLRPANLMVQPDGSTKIIDLGSAVVQGETLRERVFTPAYAAPEVLESKDWTPQSDLASLGYVLLELLTGRRLFEPALSIGQLLDEKRSLSDKVRQLLPAAFSGSGRLVKFCQRLIAPNPQDRFGSPEEADVDPDHGAYAFLQELARGKLDAVWKHDISLWLKYLRAPKAAVRDAG
ncbi:MAG: serine/threonine protein kinase [Pirellulaceae bacterium]|jgi:serine/threonine-protein kinase|nr:serine/threonine protein kinase [Pirellulaceae bacterium]MCU0978857.1 serine/threonine protein kinase [Pirellulaceae bacterium]